MLTQRVQIENERVEVVKDWPKLKSMHDIQVFLGFANCYQCFIQRFGKIARSLTSILETLNHTGLSTIS